MTEKYKFIADGLYAYIYKVMLVNQENIGNLKKNAVESLLEVKVLAITINVASPWVHLSTIPCHLFFV